MIFDPNYLIMVMLPSLILSGLAQMFVKSAYKKWGNTPNSLNLSGHEIGNRIKQVSGLTAVSFERVDGQLTDHFDPSGNVVRMSQSVATQPSVAAMAIIAHELGHAQQYADRSILIGMRSFLVPAMRFSPNIAYMLIMLGFFMNAVNLIWLGIVFFGIVVLFMLLTLPVEFDASRRGLQLLREANLMPASQDSSGARQMLTAAALTYVAAFVSALLTLLYYISIAQGRSRD